MSDPDAPSFDTMFQQADAPVHATPDSRTDEYGYNASMPMGKADDFAAPGTTDSDCMCDFSKHYLMMTISIHEALCEPRMDKNSSYYDG